MQEAQLIWITLAKIFKHSVTQIKIYTSSCLQIYGGPGSLSHDYKIWTITFQGSGPSGPFRLSCEKISL